MCHPPWFSKGAPLSRPVPPPVAVVVPVYNAYEETARCIASLAAHTTRARLLLIDDASGDPRIPALMAAAEKIGFECLRNRRNLGYTATAALGMEMAGADDVLLLNSDTEVGPGWLASLRLAAYSEARVGTATAVSNNAGPFSLPQPGYNKIPDGLTAADCTRLAARAFTGQYPYGPTAHGFCYYLKREMLDDVGGLDIEKFPAGYGEENELSLRALDRGWRHIIDVRTYVRHVGSSSFGNERSRQLRARAFQILSEKYPDYWRANPHFYPSPLLNQARQAFGDALKQALREKIKPLPRLLMVGARKTEYSVLAASLSAAYEPFFLLCRDGELSLAAWRQGDWITLETLGLKPTAPYLERYSAEYDRAVARWLFRHNMELAHIFSLAGHSLSLPRLLASLSIPAFFSIDDFHPLCPNSSLTTPEGRFCGGRCGGRELNCQADEWPLEEMGLHPGMIERWRERMAAVLAQGEAWTSSAAWRAELLSQIFQAPGGWEILPDDNNRAAACLDLYKRLS